MGLPILGPLMGSALPVVRFAARLLLALVAVILCVAPAAAQTPQPDRQPLTAIPASRAAERVGVITVRGPIDPLSLQTIARRLEQAVADGCDAIVIELDTPGGELQTTMAICHLLKTSATTNKVAWVRPQALSAGAIIALACREIIMSDASSIGDAAPIAILPGQGLTPLPAAERAKMESPVLAEVTESAARHGYDMRLVRAFIRTGDELWLIERDDGRRLFADAREFEIAFGFPPTRGARVTEEEITNLAPPIPELPSGGDGDEAGNGDAAADADILALEQQIALEQTVHEPRIAAGERGRWRLIGQVDTADELVTLRAAQAVSFGLARAIVNTDEELLRFFGGQRIERYDESWSEALVRFLISWPVRMVLIVVVVISFFIEMATPGVGVFGAVATAGLLALVGAPALAGLAEWWEILCIALGIALVAVEFFVAPGLGVAGLSGAVLLLVGLVFSFTGGDLSSPQAQNDLVIGLVSVIGAFLLSFVGIAVILRRMPEARLFRRLILDTTLSRHPELAAVGVASADADAIGVTLTDCRPAGRARFGDRVLEVRSRGGWIAAGSTVIVIDRDGLGAVVEEHTA